VFQFDREEFAIMKNLFGVVVFAGLILVLHASAIACSCLESAAPAEELKSSAAVFSAKVREIKRSAGNVEVGFKVIKQWKGNGRPAQVVFTASSSAACGYTFQRGESYLVYAGEDEDGRLVTSHCRRTAKLKDAGRDVKELDRALASPATKGGSNEKRVRPAILQ
jgi:hypothetical protein